MAEDEAMCDNDGRRGRWTRQKLLAPFWSYFTQLELYGSLSSWLAQLVGLEGRRDGMSA